MKLTIITPTLNSLPDLVAAIKSVLEQNAAGVEHLIVDGGSSDGTLELVRDFGHLRVLEGRDEGIYDAMNTGVSASSGEWIYFLGNDDQFADESVLRDILPLLNEQSDVVYGDVVSTRFGGRYDGVFDPDKIRKKNICHQSIFFRRSVFERIGAFNTQYRSHADWDHNMRWILSRDIRKKYVDRVIADYADGGFSSVTPDLVFQRDKLFRYLSYGRSAISPLKYYSLLIKEFLSGLKHRDWDRIKRSLTLLKFSGET